MFVLLVFKALSVFSGSSVAIHSNKRLCSFVAYLLLDAIHQTGTQEERAAGACHITAT
jgi:hypothetical protein